MTTAPKASRATLARVEARVFSRGARTGADVVLFIDGQMANALAGAFPDWQTFHPNKKAAGRAASALRRGLAVALEAFEAANGNWLEHFAALAAVRHVDVQPDPDGHRRVDAMLAKLAAKVARSEAKRQAVAAELAAAPAEQPTAAPPARQAPAPWRRVVILACSATKRPDAGLLPASDRYDGPMWRTWRAAVAELEAPAPSAVVLSAEFGLIPAGAPIPDYERRMDAARTAELAADPVQLGRLAAALAGARELYIAGGRLYRDAVLAMVAELRRRGELAGLVITARDGRGIGQQRADLRAWLTSTEGGQVESHDVAPPDAGGTDESPARAVRPGARPVLRRSGPGPASMGGRGRGMATPPVGRQPSGRRTGQAVGGLPGGAQRGEGGGPGGLPRGGRGQRPGEQGRRPRLAPKRRPLLPHDAPIPGPVAQHPTTRRRITA